MNNLSQPKWIGGPTNKKLNLSFQDLENQRIMRIFESFNGSFRDECLNTNWFLSLDDAKQKIEDWRDEYNTFSPHSCLGDLTPEIFIENPVKTANFSNFE